MRVYENQLLQALDNLAEHEEHRASPTTYREGYYDGLSDMYEAAREAERESRRHIAEQLGLGAPL